MHGQGRAGQDTSAKSNPGSIELEIGHEEDDENGSLSSTSTAKKTKPWKATSVRWVHSFVFSFLFFILQCNTGMRSDGDRRFQVFARVGSGWRSG